MKALHNHLINRVITEFVTRHVRDPRVFDPTNEMDLQALTKCGISLNLPPDVIVHDRERDWWFLIDATPDRSHISELRKAELVQCFLNVKNTWL